MFAKKRASLNLKSYYWRLKFFVSGVVLANASLDIAFHDTVKIDFCNVAAFMLPTIKNKNVGINNNYVKMFWVGLMDGD